MQIEEKGSSVSVDADTPVSSGRTVAPTAKTQVRAKLSAKVVVAAALGIIILIGGAGSAFWWVRHKSKDSGKVNTTEKAPTIEPQAVHDVNVLLAEGKTGDAAKTINDNSSLKNSRDGQMLLAGVALNQNKYDDAITIYKGIVDKYGWTANIADQLAQCYEAKRDTANEITYYKKELELLQSDTSNIARQTEIERVQARLKELQAS